METGTGARAIARSDFPLFAFSHCRDVVAEVSRAGGFGVLGANMFTPEELDAELSWIDARVAGMPYGVDILVPEKLAEPTGAAKLLDEVAAHLPEPQLLFTRELLAAHGLTLAAPRPRAMPSAALGEALIDVALRHPISLIASALGTAPPLMIERAREAGVAVAALVGAKEHAIKQLRAGVDIIVAQGSEAGGHCGEVSTLVLVPEVVSAVRAERNVPVLAAGGIATGRQMAACFALGAEGAWTGSVWLPTPESEISPVLRQRLLAASSRDTVRSRSRTGKPCRMLRSTWTDAWDDADTPKPLAMPQQSALSEPALEAALRAAEAGDPKAAELTTYYAGQGIGLVDQQMSARAVVHAFRTDFLDAIERLESLLDRADHE